MLASSLITTSPISSLDLTQDTAHPECGALCTFEGIVRNHHHGKKVTKMIYEAYAPMAEKVLSLLIKEIQTEWPGCHVRLKHRYGEMHIGDVAVAIAVWAPHRREAFRACEAAIDRIKLRCPIWKQEFYQDGDYEWVGCSHQSE